MAGILCAVAVAPAVVASVPFGGQLRHLLFQCLDPFIAVVPLEVEGTGDFFLCPCSPVFNDLELLRDLQGMFDCLFAPVKLLFDEVDVIVG